jgi:hypothetical protein
LCNQLIRERLTEDGEDVHWVILVGGGARYPAVVEALHERLNLPFLEDRLMLDAANLQLAVAKGAVLALAAQEYAETAATFDSDLARRLPFDVAYPEMWTGTQRILFRARQLYEELRPQTVPLPAGGGPRHLVLTCRWPGEERFAAFLRFEFSAGTPRDTASVRYDVASGTFVAEVGEQRGTMYEIGATAPALLGPIERRES